jgi:LmbE family N-acetylglucosaminyl deacetylase/protein-L-isoaspartate O-methyltransferase
VVAAHPDDESLGAGGLVARAVALGIPVTLVCATDGEGSHPDSPSHTPADLAQRRSEEGDRAAHELGVADPVVRLALPDGGVAAHTEALTTTLVDLVGDGRSTVLAATWSEDGHPDHDAVGRAAATAARRTEATLWEYAVWFWHWGGPHDPRADRFRALPLEEHDHAAKQRAIAAHASQVAPLSTLSGDETLLPPEFLAHFEGAQEWFLVTPGRECPDHELDRLHQRSTDPWGVDSRWYEERKRALLLAMLPRPGFGRVLEIGCSTGALTEALAGRADHVLGVDRSPAALAAARRRLADRLSDGRGVDLADMDIPTAWPEGRFELVVVSEVGYFLSPAAADELAARIAASLTPDGVFVLCHWRHPVEGWVMDAAEVHRRFERDDLPPVQARYVDRDVELVVHAATWPGYDR